MDSRVPLTACCAVAYFLCGRVVDTGLLKQGADAHWLQARWPGTDMIDLSD